MASPRASAFILLTCAMAAVGGYFAYAVLFANTTIPNNANVQTTGVGVYWESTCVTAVESIDWGYLEPGTARDVTVYVRNQEPVPMTLSMNATDWEPLVAAPYMTVSWNREAHLLNSGETAATTITLSVSSQTTGFTNFRFNITIAGTE